MAKNAVSLSDSQGCPSFLFKNLHRCPCVIWRRPSVFERAIHIHFRKKIVRIKFEKTRKQNLRLSEIACAEFLQSFLTRIKPLHKFAIQFFVAPTNESKNIDWFGFAFHLHSSNRAKMNLVLYQL